MPANRYTTSRPNTWIAPRQTRWSDWGHGTILPAYQDNFWRDLWDVCRLLPKLLPRGLFVAVTLGVIALVFTVLH